jgi:hypothetical protein
MHQQHLERLFQRFQVSLDNVPYDKGISALILVEQQVSEAGNLGL